MSYAAQKAVEVLSDCWDGTLPVNVEKIAHCLGVEVIKRHEYGAITPPEGISKNEDDEYYDISGRFDWVGNKPVATVRTTDAEPRQRFTLAHELGHFVLGHGGGFRDNAAAVANFTNYNRAEVDANAFAAELLMPELLVNQLIEVEKVRNIEKLAEIFFVSCQAMRVRLKNLGWL